MSRYLHHLTLTTGHLRRSYRSEVSDDAVAYAAQLLTEAHFAGRAHLVGEIAHFGLTVKTAGHALIATIDGPAGPHAPGKPFRGVTMPLVTMAVPRKSRVAPQLWDLITEGIEPLPEPLPERPPSPWCAVILHPTIRAYESDAVWMGDFERTVAWAWIESAKGDLDAAANR